MRAIDILKNEKERIIKILNHTNSEINDHNDDLNHLHQKKEDYEKTIKDLDNTIIKLEEKQ